MRLVDEADDGALDGISVITMHVLLVHRDKYTLSDVIVGRP